MSQLRLTLLVFGVLFIAALIWWERRRPRQASPDGAERYAARDPEAAAAAPVRSAREPGLALPEMHARESFAAHPLPVVEASREPAAVPVLSPFAPLPVSVEAAPPEPEPEIAELRPLPLPLPLPAAPAVEPEAAPGS